MDESDSENEIQLVIRPSARLAMNRRPSVDAISQRLPKRNTPGHHASTSRSRRELGTAEATPEEEEPVATLEDLDVLNCPICCEPLTTPVYQCDEGHLACVSCCQKISKCPSCAKPTGKLRCRVIERVVQSAKLPCVNKQLGCIEKLSNIKKLDHEQKECKYAPAVSCPYCQYAGPSRFLYVHFAEQHPSSGIRITLNSFTNLKIYYEDARHIVLQESVNETLFVLTCFTKRCGTLVTVTCMADAASDAKFSYELMATTGNNKVYLKNLVELAPKLIAHQPEKNCLLITKDFYSATPAGRPILPISLKIMKLS